jgi:cholesterol transport system auxiliary component
MVRLSSIFRTIAVATLLPALAACGAVSALSDATTPMEVIVLEAPSDLPLRQGRPLPRDIIVEEPTAGGALNTDRIMIQPGALQAQYLPDVRWSDPAPVMLQTLMLRALDQTAAFQYVGRRPLGPGGDFAILTEIVDFQAELAPTATARRSPCGSSCASCANGAPTWWRPAPSRRARGRSRSTISTSPEAFDAATGRVLSEFTVWALSTLGAI